MRSERCRFAVLRDTERGNSSCVDCEKVQDQIDLLRNVQIEHDNTDDHRVFDVEFHEVRDDTNKENIETGNSDNIRKNIICPITKRRLSKLKGITIVDQFGSLFENYTTTERFIFKNTLCAFISWSH